MQISNEEKKQEQLYLAETINVIREKLSTMGQDMFKKEETIKSFQNYMWDSKADLDPQEMASVMVSSQLDWYFLEQKTKYFKTLFKIQNNPYFGSIHFVDDNNTSNNIYIGITHLEDDSDNHLINDWRSPICSLFYDYELGKCSYEAPGGIVEGTLKKKRQYRISGGKLIHIFDNEINIDDELLQEVLASESSEKMKNIVNTIQKEQNNIIRNTKNKNLIVQGIAGSGKTSVALHRIAFLLYKIKNLTSKNVLIFSPNRIFTEYISNVLPELGEDNTMQTTFNDFLASNIKEYKKVESFTEFISRYYKYQENNPDFVRYKQSDEIIIDIDSYIQFIIRNCYFTKDINENGNYISKKTLNELFHQKYAHFVINDRLKEMALKFSENNYNGSRIKVKTYYRLLKESLNLKLDYKNIYYEFFKSRYCNFEVVEKEIEKIKKSSTINYEDANLFVYMKSLIDGYAVNMNIHEIVVDEAQDYTRLQYLIISKIFKKSNYTILGDINQTINPYYHYSSLENIATIFKGNTKYMELTKTYRSSAEIIEYSNNVLGLNHVSAIRKANELPVIIRNENNDLKELLIRDIDYLDNKYKSIAIITKDDYAANEIYELLRNDYQISLITDTTENFNKELIIIPAYIAKGLEFDSVIVYNDINNKYKDSEKYLYYVAVTRAQHELIIYNN